MFSFFVNLLISCDVMYYFCFKLNSCNLSTLFSIHMSKVKTLAKHFVFPLMYFFVYAHIEVPIFKGHVSHNIWYKKCKIPIIICFQFQSTIF